MRARKSYNVERDAKKRKEERKKKKKSHAPTLDVCNIDCEMLDAGGTVAKLKSHTQFRSFSKKTAETAAVGVFSTRSR